MRIMNIGFLNGNKHIDHLAVFFLMFYTEKYNSLVVLVKIMYELHLLDKLMLSLK